MCHVIYWSLIMIRMCFTVPSRLTCRLPPWQPHTLSRNGQNLFFSANVVLYQVWTWLYIRMPGLWDDINSPFPNINGCTWLLIHAGIDWSWAMLEKGVPNCYANGFVLSNQIWKLIYVYRSFTQFVIIAPYLLKVFEPLTQCLFSTMSVWRLKPSEVICLIVVSLVTPYSVTTQYINIAPGNK